jgi:diacylglycerol kinase family enzyme
MLQFALFLRVILKYRQKTNQLHHMELKVERNRKILFVVNPGAGSAPDNDIEDIINGQFKDDQRVAKIMVMKNKNNDLLMDEYLDEFDPGTVVACGGDGTVNFVAGHILGKDINLGIIPLGSFNGMAYQVGIPNDIDEAMEIIKGDHVSRADVIRINSEFNCLHLSDLGTNARVIRRHKSARVKGFMGYIVQYFKELCRTKKFRCRIRTEKSLIKKKVAMLIIANAAYYGTGVNVNPQAKLDDGKFEIVLIRSYPFWYLFYVFFALLRGRSGEKRWTNIITCDRAEITVNPAQEMQIDGEVAGYTSKISPEIMPHQLKILSRE